AAAAAAGAEAAGARGLRLHPNQGKGGAVRAGVLAAEGEIIAYADADMNVAPCNLREALRRLEPANPPADSPGPNLQRALRRLEPANTAGDPPDPNLQQAVQRLEGRDDPGRSREAHNTNRQDALQ